MNINRLAAGAFIALLTTQAAAAATSSVATVNVNLRAGPGAGYPVVRVVPQGALVATHGCLADYSWCDVRYAGARGWVSARYVTTTVAGTTVIVGPRVGLPVVTFSAAYWDRYYTSYAWYHHGPAYYGASRVKSVDSGCGPRGCAATVTGAYGGSASEARGCGPRACGSAGTVTGPNGGTVSGARACGPRGCVGGRKVVGPEGATRAGAGGFRW